MWKEWWCEGRALFSVFANLETTLQAGTCHNIEMTSERAGRMPKMLERKAQECCRHEQDGEHDRKSVQEELCSSSLMVRGTEVISAKGASETRTALLQENGGNEEDGEGDLYVRKYGTDNFHCGDDDSTGK
jgi:hypothetical protein